LTHVRGQLKLSAMDGYQQFQPIEAFRALIDAYWVNRPELTALGAAPFDRVLPDGCIDLIFRGGAGGGALFSSALIERPLYFADAARGWFVGVRFRPAMARALLDVEPAACRDREIRAAIIDRRFAALENELQDCASPETALAKLRRWVDARLAACGGRVAPVRVQEAIALLARGSGASHVAKVAHAVGMTERSLRRELTLWSGLAPKSLGRILRMQRALAAIRAGRAPLALIALDTGYADQAHMTRELKALTGFTPAQVARPMRHPQAVRNLQDAA
jgi:AraC-like DNA-binding protein